MTPVRAACLSGRGHTRKPFATTQRFSRSSGLYSGFRIFGSTKREFHTHPNFIQKGKAYENFKT